MKIVVLAGGLSTERNVSFSSGSKICKALRDAGHQAVLMDMFLGMEEFSVPADQIFSLQTELKERTISNTAPDLDAVRASRKDQSKSVFGPGVLEVCGTADLVFIALHGACGEDGRIQATFDLMGIPYTGSGYLGSAIAMDKIYTKRLVQGEGVRTPSFRTAEVTQENWAQLAAEAVLPCVIKIPNGGSSIGVTICHDRKLAERTLEEAGKSSDTVLIEQYIKGRELSCGVLNQDSLPPIEIISKNESYDYECKYQPGGAVEICPAQITQKEEAEIRDFAKRVHTLLGLTTYSRSDFMLDEEGKAWFLEVNTLPGMTPTSLIPQEAGAVGIDYQTLCETIVSSALQERG
jgi:D-alanine-D-alanine ligase